MISFSTCSAHSGCRIQVNSIFKHVFRNEIQAFPLHRFGESAKLPVNIRTKYFFKLPGKCLYVILSLAFRGIRKIFVCHGLTV